MNSSAIRVILHPGEGIEIDDRGMLRFDTHRDEVLRYLNVHKPPLKETGITVAPFEEYVSSLGIFLGFRSSEDLRLSSVGFFDDYDVYLEGQKIFDTPFESLIGWFRQQDPQLLEHEFDEVLWSARFALMLLWNHDTYPDPYVAKTVYLFLPPFHEALRENVRR